MTEKSKGQKASLLRLMLAAGLCAIFFTATTPSDDSCAEYENKGSVRVDNNKIYKIQVWIGDNGPFTCEARVSSAILHVEPGNHVYVWLSVGIEKNGKRIFGGGTVEVKVDRQSVIVIPKD